MAVGLGQLKAKLVGERRLAGVARAEQRHVGLRLEDQRDLVGEAVHTDDLGWVVDGAVPDEGIQCAHHAHCTVASVQSGTMFLVQQLGSGADRASARAGNHAGTPPQSLGVCWSLQTNEVLGPQPAGHTSKVHEQRAPGGDGRVIDLGMSGNQDDGVGCGHGIVERDVLKP